MTYRLDNDARFESEDAPRRSSWTTIIVVLGLAATGSAAALLWRGYQHNLPTFGLLESIPAEFRLFGSTSPVSAAEKVATQKELQEFRQQVTGQIQAGTQLLGSQQAEIRHLSEQLNALALKLEILQRSATVVQGPTPSPPIPKPVAPRVPLPQKKPAVPRPAESPPDGVQTPPLQLSR